MNFLFPWRRRPLASHGSVYVTEKFGVRSLHIGSDTIQSSMRIARPNDLELAYTRSMMAFLLFGPEPRRVLLVGLGGGSLVKFIYHRMPQAQCEVVEVSPDVVSVARRWFQVPAGDGRFQIHVCDGADFLARPGPAYDAILVDGYDGHSQVAALSTRDFYDACRSRLEARGTLVVNLWGSDKSFNTTLERIEAAYPAGTLCLPAEKPGNVIALAFRDSQSNPRWDELDARAADLEARLGLEFGRFVRGLRKMNSCDGERLYISAEAAASP